MSCLWHPVRPLADCISSHLQSLIPSCWAVNMTTWQYSVYVALPTSDYLSLTFNILFQNRSFAIRQCGPKCMIVFSDICFHGRLWPLFNVMYRGTRCIHCLFSGYELLGCFLFVSWFRYFSGLEPNFLCVCKRIFFRGRGSVSNQGLQGLASCQVAMLYDKTTDSLSAWQEPTSKCKQSWPGRTYVVTMWVYHTAVIKINQWTFLWCAP